MRIAITGSSGLVGTRPAAAARRADGHEVVPVVRGARAGPAPSPGTPPPGQLDPGDARGPRRASSTWPARASAPSAGTAEQKRARPREPHGGARRSWPRRWPPPPSGRRCWSRARPSGSTATGATRCSPRRARPAPGFLTEVCMAWEAATAAGRGRRHPGGPPAHVARARPRTAACCRKLAAAVQARAGRPAGVGSPVDELDHAWPTRSRRSASCSPTTSRGPVNAAAPDPVTNAAMSKAHRPGPAPAGARARARVRAAAAARARAGRPAPVRQPAGRAGGAPRRRLRVRAPRPWTARSERRPRSLSAALSSLGLHPDAAVDADGLGVHVAVRQQLEGHRRRTRRTCRGGRGTARRA